MEQRQNEWYQIRRGKLTASNFHCIEHKRDKNGNWKPSAKYLPYVAQTVAEKITGEDTPLITTYDQKQNINRGIEKEPDAVAHYSLVKGVEVASCGFIPHPSIPDAGGSPDGLVGDDGIIEIKSPMTKTHMLFLLYGVVDQKYIYQMQWNLACTGRAWCDFISFDDRINYGSASMSIKRFERDCELIKDMEEWASLFVNEVQDGYTKIMNEFY